MGKVICFELKKLVSRIGIYILVLLMAGLLVAGMFMYKPEERKIESYSLVGETISDMYANFIDDGVKANYDATIAEIAAEADTYVPSSVNYAKYNDGEEITKLFEIFDEYCVLYYDATATSNEYDLFLVGINESLADLKAGLTAGLNSAKNATGYYILCTNDTYTELFSVLNKISLNFASPISHKIAGEKYVNEYRAELSACLNKLVYPSLDDTAKKYTASGVYHSIITLRMEEIAYKMDQIKANALKYPELETNPQTKKELNSLFNRYVNCVKIFEQSYSSSMCVDALYSVKGKTARANLLGYADVSLYQQEQTSVEYKYYIEHHSNSTDFANSLSITHTSNTKINAYDYTYFVMSLFAVIVIIFAIYLSAHTISGEINNNTMRFTAVRPIRRGSIFFGKYLAVMLISLILLLFGTATALIIGGITYGFDSANILMIINSSYIMVAHPMAVVALFVLSLLLIVAFYSALTIMLSSVIKSDLLTMVISVVFYVINLILPLFFGANSWLKFYFGTNLNTFAYFGVNRLTSDNLLGQLFNNVVYHGMSLWISIIYVVGITALLLWIGRTIFKKRDL